jgi:hypothetical protein
MAEPDEIVKIGRVHEYLDGSIGEQVRGFRKVIEFDVTPRADGSDRRFLANFILSTSKTLSYSTYIADVVTENDNLVSEWLHECELNRQFTVRLIDNHVFQAWEDTETQADEDMYCKLNVPITGTSTSPQSFTTGAAPLALLETDEDWPSFSNTTHVHTVVLTPNSSCQFTPCLVGNPTISAGTVTFQAFISDFQVPASDGLYYMDFRLYLQARPQI